MKYTDEQKQKFRDLVAGGKSLKESASEAGISLAIGLKLRGEDNRKKRGESSPPPAEPQQEQEEENLSEGEVPPPGSGGGGAEDGSGARGAEGAASALTDEEEDSKEEKEEEPGTPETEAAKEKARQEAEAKKNALDPAETLVNLSQMLSSMMVWGFAKRKKVKLTAEQREELAWSEAERAELLRYARPAASVLPRFIEMLGPYVGLAFYGWILYGVTESRCEQVAACGPGRKAPAGEDEEEIRDAVWEEKKEAPLNDASEGW